MSESNKRVCIICNRNKDISKFRRNYVVHEKKGNIKIKKHYSCLKCDLKERRN